jgi:hypothetical protein
MYGELNEYTIEDQVIRGLCCSIKNPAKTAIVRFPTSDEQAERESKIRILETDLGRGATIRKVEPTLKPDAKLFNQIRLDKGEPFDDFEAARIISWLSFCDLTGCEQEDGLYRVTIKTHMGETVHFMRVPTERQFAEYQRRIPDAINLPYNRREIRGSVEAQSWLYDQLMVRTEGYAKDFAVPPHHKRDVISAITFEVRNIDDGTDPNS